MTKKLRLKLDFSQRGAQSTFDWTRNEVEQAWDEQRDREVGDWDALAESLTNIETEQRFGRYVHALSALAAYLAGGVPTAEHRERAEAILANVAPPKRGRPLAARRADRDPKLALAAVYARMIRRVWRAHGLALNGDATKKADEWAARMALGEIDISREGSSKCSDLEAAIPAELGRASDRSYAATPLTELEPHRPTSAGNPSL